MSENSETTHVPDKSSELVAEDNTEQTLKYLTQQADANNFGCLDVALVKAALKLNPNIQLGLAQDEWDRILNSKNIGKTPAKDLFHSLSEFESKYGVSVKRVFSTSHNLQKIDIPEHFTDKVDLSGKANTDGINVRLFHKVVAGKTYGHAEVDDGTEDSKIRIAQMDDEGWITTVLVELDEPSGSRE